METYNKLVRDKIPEIVTSKGLVPTTHIADNDEYRQKLKEKLLEEVHEFIQDENAEEMVDVIEVLAAIKLFKNFNDADLENLRQKKIEERGAFYSKIILETVKSPNE